MWNVCVTWDTICWRRLYKIRFLEGTIVVYKGTQSVALWYKHCPVYCSCTMYVFNVCKHVLIRNDVKRLWIIKTINRICYKFQMFIFLQIMFLRSVFHTYVSIWGCKIRVRRQDVIDTLIATRMIVYDCLA